MTDSSSGGSARNRSGSRPRRAVTRPPTLVDVVRDGVVESAHRGYAAVVRAEGATIRSIGGDPVVYTRSTVKPFQALAVLDVLAGVDRDLSPQSVAIACASHQATHDQVIEAAQLLALAGLDESALQCPPALPTSPDDLSIAARLERIASNCSGKHAAFLLAQVLAGEDPDTYLDPGSTVQRRVRERLADVAGTKPVGPGVDGCGAPAWRLPLSALARGFARLAAATEPPLATVLSAMRSRPDLVGGPGAPDTDLMLADGRVVAKRGAEAVFAAGATDLAGATIGVAVKIADGGTRAAAPVAAALLRAHGARVPDAVVEPPVLGGGRPRGALAVRLPAPA